MFSGGRTVTLTVQLEIVLPFRPSDSGIFAPRPALVNAPAPIGGRGGGPQPELLGVHVDVHSTVRLVRVPAFALTAILAAPPKPLWVLTNGPLPETCLRAAIVHYRSEAGGRKGETHGGEADESHQACAPWSGVKFGHASQDTWLGGWQ